MLESSLYCFLSAVATVPRLERGWNQRESEVIGEHGNKVLKKVGGAWGMNRRKTEFYGQRFFCTLFHSFIQVTHSSGTFNLSGNLPTFEDLGMNLVPSYPFSHLLDSSVSKVLAVFLYKSLLVLTSFKVGTFESLRCKWR